MSSSLRKWSNFYTGSDSVEVHTRMFDMGDITTIKDIYSVKITLGGSTGSTVSVNVYYRLNDAGYWLFFGNRNSIPKVAKLMNIIPIPSPNNEDIIKTTTLNSDGLPSVQLQLL